ncbi:nucleoside recognition domain-containing protein [Penaeicola halotolerans]|uniref:nucleoside recognition domain-containing protein n=1 Tax=Penaeicola halotolerans TaxID=2793196 RepID=UPI001CF81DDA|nr:spore maturation protein [Penaeicola halotolerans]
MVLNYIWIGFFLIAFVIALIKLIFLGDVEIFPALVNSTFDMSKTGFEIALFLTGVISLWLGLMRIAEDAGVVKLISRAVQPLFLKLFPEIPKNDPVIGPMLMNFSMNFLGLDNAATPLGLKSMEGMQRLNKTPDTASNAQIMFLVLNTSGLTAIPISIMVYRAQMGAADPSDVFIPILLATFFSSLTGLIVVSLYQKINLLNKVVLAYLGTLTLLITGVIWYFSTLTQAEITSISSVASNLILFSIISFFIFMGWIKRINIYESFIDGAKEGFKMAISIVPYLIAMLVAIGVFRASGALDYIVDGMRWIVTLIGVNADFVEAMPTALMKPLSGSGARGMMLETMDTYGADSFVGRVSSVLQGSTETTLYVIAVYFGAVNIRKTRYAITAGLIADLAGITAAIIISYLFFH